MSTGPLEPGMETPEAIESVLRARARALTERRVHAEPEVDGAERLVVDAGGIRAALDLAGIERISALGELTPLPGAPAVVAGLAFLEGRVLPVADLSRLLGGQSEHLRTVVITGSGEGTLALGVDAYLGVRRIADDAFEAPPTPLQEPAARYASTMTRDGILLLDLESIRRDLLSGASPV